MTTANCLEIVGDFSEEAFLLTNSLGEAIPRPPLSDFFPPAQSIGPARPGRMRWIFRLRVADPTAAGDSLFTALIKKPPYPFTQEDIVERTLNGVLPFVTLTHATPGALLQGAYTQLPLPGAPLAIDGTIAMTLTLGTPVAALSVFNISIDFSHTLSS